MAQDWVEETGAALESWAAGRDDEIDIAGARLLMEIASDSLELRSPAELTLGGLNALLLEAFPHVVVVGTDDVPSVLAAAGSLIDYLGESETLPGDRATALRVELDRLAPEFAKIVSEADAGEQEAAAGVLAGMMEDDGVDLADEAAVRAWVERFEALPEEERFSRAADYLRDAEELVVPPVLLAPVRELADAARESGLTRRVLALAGWAAGRRVDEADELPVEDAVAAVEDLALKTPRQDGGTRSGAAGPPESMADLLELDRLWWAAIHAEVLVVHDGVTAAGPGREALEEGPDEIVLSAWLQTFESVVVAEHETGESLDPIQLVQNELTGVLIHLYEQDVPSSRDELLAALRAHIDETYDVARPDMFAASVGHALDLEIEDLLEWGVILPAGDDGLALTPLGVWGVREMLLADGFVAPEVGDLAEAPAAELVGGLSWHRDDTADEEIDRWLAVRAPQSAAAELLAVMDKGDPASRNLSAAVLHRVDAEAEPLVRAALEHPRCRPYAALWLVEHGDTELELDPDDMMWVFIDTVAGMLDSSEPAQAVEAALADAPSEADLASMIETMWRIEHDDVVEVLEALGAHHPDRAVAKTARKAAFKARSRLPAG